MLREGLRGVTHRNVAAKAGVPVGSVGYYYSNRDTLITTCFESIHARRVERAENVMADPPAPADAQAVARAVIDIVSAGHPSLLMGFFAACVDAYRETGADSSSQLKRQIAGTAELLLALLRGTEFSSTDPHEAMAALVGATILFSHAERDPVAASERAVIAVLR